MTPALTKKDASSRRGVPLWLFLFILLLWGILTVFFGWMVQTAVSEAESRGPLGKVAVEIATFPTTTKEALRDVNKKVSGRYKDDAILGERQERDYSQFTPVRTAPGIELQGLLVRADPAAAAKGWRLLIGAFTLHGEIENAALLMSPEFEIVKVWTLAETPIEGFEPRPKYEKFIHGVEMLEDGSLVFAFDGGVSLQRVDRCGQLKWAIGGHYHHAVTSDDDGRSVWTLGPDEAVSQVSVEDGSVMRHFSMDDIIAKNPMIDILEIRRAHQSGLGANPRNTTGRWLEDQFHLNDVEPLPAAIADRFAGFEAGDLLISARSLNLVFVVDPDSLEVKWWHIGSVQRQHDPDWLPNGEISILNNRMSRDFSEVVSIDPASSRRTTLFDGRKNDFYTRIRGKHQILPSGAIIVTSSQQGRAFEVNREGDVVLEFINLKPGSDSVSYVLSELKWMPEIGFDTGDDGCANIN